MGNRGAKFFYSMDPAAIFASGLQAGVPMITFAAIAGAMPPHI